MKGRKPKPAAIREVFGSRRQARHRDELPAPVVADPSGRHEPPAALGLSLEARAVWLELAPALSDAGVLTAVNVYAMADVCRAEAQVREIQRLQAEPGYERVSARGQTHALDAQLRLWLTISTRVKAEMGLTATSWQRVSPANGAGQKKASPLETLEAQASAIRRVK
jgi:P27 family predicted phage terminase small subunit